MSDIFPSLTVLFTFVMASIVLAVTPGPGVFYIVTRTLSQGRYVGIASVLGVALGNFGNVIFASLGLAALFSISSWFFIGIKAVGALYLIYLGLQHFIQIKKETSLVLPKKASFKKIFYDGCLVALFNPKTALFFAAFLPQFIKFNVTSLWQSILLGAIFVGIAVITDSLYVLMASFFSSFLLGKPSARKISAYISGVAFIGLGILTATWNM